MTRNLKALGMALMAMFALSAVVASAASASNERFHSDNITTVLTGANEAGEAGYQTFVATGDIRCTTASFAGTVTGEGGTTTTTTVTVHPKYSACHAFGSENNATVTTTGCNYIFTSHKEANNDSTVHIECETGHSIIVHTSLCTLSFGAQTPTGGVTYAEVLHNGKKSITVNATVTGIDITSKSGAGCFVVGTTGTYTGKSTVTGYTDNGETGDTTEGKTFTEGAQVNVWWA